MSPSESPCSRSPGGSSVDGLPAMVRWVGPWIYQHLTVYTRFMAKHLVDLDEKMLSAARAELGTTTIKDTVNEALRLATRERQRRTADALDVLANAPLGDRADAWR
jgi:Arc/MetJ family transcription regulator